MAPRSKNEGVRALLQGLLKGRLDREHAERLLEHAPRLADCLMDGLSVSGQGDVGPRELLAMASDGKLVAGLVSRALST